MNYYKEDKTDSEKLYNKEVTKLLFKYIFRYKKYLLIAIIFVMIITSVTLAVPYLSKVVIDRFIIKKGYIVNLPNFKPKTPDDYFLESKIRKSIKLDGTHYFFIQSELKYFSKIQIDRYKKDNIFSKEKFVLIEKPIVDNNVLKEKLNKLKSNNKLYSYPGERYLVIESALSEFKVSEIYKLRVTDFKNIVYIVIAVLILQLVQFLASYFQIIFLMKLSQFSMRDLRQDLFEHIASLETKYFDENPIGKLVSRVTNDIETLNEMFSSVLITLLQDLLMMSGILIIMFLTSVKLAIIVTATIPFIVILTVLFRIKAREAYRRIRTQVARINAFLNETITGIRIIQIFVQELKNLKKFRKINKDLYKANIKQLYVYAIFRPSIGILRWLAIASLIYFGAKGILAHTVSYGVIVMFITYIGRFFEPVQDLSEKFDIMQSATAAGEKILFVFNANYYKESEENDKIKKFLLDYLKEDNLDNIKKDIKNNVEKEIRNKVGKDLKNDIKKEVKSKAEKDVKNNIEKDIKKNIKEDIKENIKNDNIIETVNFIAKNGYSKNYFRFKGDIVFDKVWFAYKKDQWVLKDLSFHIKPEETLAIVGETGAGKSTIINILSKFYRIQKGNIYIDGININDIPIPVLRRNISIVMQDVFLFSKTVKENIILNSEFDKKKFEFVAKITHIDKFIEKLPKKENEMVMERGVTFSAGERQLLSFARSLYFDPSILVLDEATSNIDTETEKLIQDAIAHLIKGRTSIVVAHRLSTIKNANNILVIDKGIAVESGDHASLIAKKGIYYQLYKLQFSS